jgi:methyl-accepting chemotaxis protein-1 (serine sensor receptor)
MDLEAVKARGEEVLSKVLPNGNRLRLQLTIALIAATAFTAHARSVDVGFEAPDAACAGAPASIARVEDLFDAQANAREALVTIRRNAQDWKNLLLRGSNAADRQTMQQRFETQASL